MRATQGEGGYAELREWKSDVVGPRLNARPSVSDVTSPCPTKRDVWLRRVLRVRVDGEVLVLGRAAHEVFLYPFRYAYRGFDRLVRRFDRVVRGLRGVDGLRGVLWEVYRKAVVLALSAVEEGLPFSVELRVPGAPIGLSDFIKPDLVVGFIPVDLALAPRSSCGFERKELALAGYALALEAWTGHPVDYSVVLYVNVNGDVRFKWRVVRIDDSLRRRFLELRDEVARIIEHGIEPEPPEFCPESCPYREVCRGARGLRG